MRKTDELYERAANAFSSGDFDGAKKWANECLKVDKKEFRSLNLLGVILSSEGKTEAAANAYKKSLEANPKNPQTLNNIANLLSKTDKQAALAYYAKAAELEPSFSIPRHNMAKIYLSLDGYDEAVSYAASAFELDSTVGAPLITLGTALKKKGDTAAATEAYKIALNYADSRADGYLEIGVMCREEKKYDEAIAYFAEALKARPDYAAAYCNLSTVLIDKGEFQKSKGAILKALELNPNDPITITNFGVVLKNDGDYTAAKEAFIKAIELGGGSEAPKTNLGILLMLEGDYENGLALYDSRPKSTILCDKPIHNGENIDGKTLLVYHEQGFGDTINFARLLKDGKLCGANIIFSPQEPLKSVFEGSDLGLRIMSHTDIETTKPYFDYHLPLMDLLRICGVKKGSIPKNMNFINIDKSKKEMFASKTETKKPKIGIVWRGNREYIGDHRRSIEPSVFASLSTLGGCFVSLQKEYQDGDIEKMSQNFEIFDFSADLNDFSDTAALIDGLDCVISVDTSVAHLAATMEKPTFILLPFSPDWRWGLDGEQSEWYDKAVLIRQKGFDDWESVIERLKNKLEDLLVSLQ